MSELIESFVAQVDGFENLKKSEQIIWFAFFLSDQNQGCINIESVIKCFHELDIPPYSNVGQFLKQSKSFYIKGKSNDYSLTREAKIGCDTFLNKPKVVLPSNNLFPKEILNGTRQYIEIVGNQGIVSYDYGQYDACMIMCRKLIEILIIESFERYKIEHKIKDSNGNFFYLSGLISAIESESIWSISRNSLKSLATIKKNGDLSAHNRRYTAKKPDVDKIKHDIRIVVEELIHLIDYPKWK